MIYSFYLNRSELNIDPIVLKKEIEKFPAWVQEEIFKYRKEEDREIRMLGKLVLKYGLHYLGFESDKLIQQLITDANGKPKIPEASLYFNLAHADDYIICVLADKYRVGVDIEKIKDAKIEDFWHILRDDEKLEINTIPNCKKAFYRLWTQKEACVKADGRGLLFPIEKVVISNDIGLMDTDRWYLKELSIAPDYVCYLAVDTREAREIVTEKKIQDSKDLI
ncbi:4'-phosphopantetheinyl transferase family protein [Myroides odoratus]|uniref:4'-phosphopantetheinyl transferase family protein n=1 Tax=Myroides odoratus TaxID=256 RepID=UPI0039AF1C2B